AGSCPTIRGSHVDEPGGIAKAAVGAGVSVDDLPIATKVMVLAQATANAVYPAYKDVAEVSTNAHGDEVTGFPLEAAQSTADSAHTDDAQTRDFSGVRFPTRT
ncbi:septum formation protein Maf, partial [Bifidobacterium animalis]|nr:septum formation protein Maf [Bifidobacterium animalis]